MTVQLLREQIKHLPGDLKVVLKIDTYNTKSTYDSNTSPHEMHTVEGFSVAVNKEAFEITPYDSIVV